LTSPRTLSIAFKFGLTFCLSVASYAQDITEGYIEISDSVKTVILYDEPSEVTQTPATFLVPEGYRITSASTSGTAL
ncbi:MAG: hypothetical protein ACI8Z5_001358, partial [Lentimonas sp.]